MRHATPIVAKAVLFSTALRASQGAAAHGRSEAAGLLA
jgi:hypothetical protein